MTINLTPFHWVKVQLNKSLLSTEIVLKIYLYVDKKEFNQSQYLEEKSLVTSLALEKQLLRTVPTN